MESLPLAPKRFPVPADPHRLKAGTKLWRIYYRGGKHPTAWNTFRYFGPTGGRFDHHTYPKRLQGRGILYATVGRDAIFSAIAEFFQDTREVDREFNAPWIASFPLTGDLLLLNTSGDWAVRAGGNMAINSGSRNKARQWSRSIYRNYTDIEGILYPSSLTNQPCVALYERAARSLPVAPTFNDSLASPKLFAGLTQLAARLNYVLK